MLLGIQASWNFRKEELLEHQAILSVLSQENAECFRQGSLLFHTEGSAAVTVQPGRAEIQLAQQFLLSSFTRQKAGYSMSSSE